MEFRSLKALAIALTTGACVAVVAAEKAATEKAATEKAPAAKAQGQAGSAAAPAAAPATTPTTAQAPGTTQPGPTVPGQAPTSAPAATPGSAMAYSDAEIMGLVLAVDTNEIEMAQAAEKQKLTKDGKSFAKMIRKEHSKNADKILKLGKTLKMDPVRSQAATDLRAKGAAELQTLSTKTGTEFEPAFMTAMVNGHTEALQLIDSQLIPNAKDEKLKKQLAETRGHVAAHLEQAKRLQGAQASAPASTP